MGSGTRVGQWKERFFEGEIEREEAFEDETELQSRKEEVSRVIASFGEL